MTSDTMQQQENLCNFEACEETEDEFTMSGWRGGSSSAFHSGLLFPLW